MDLMRISRGRGLATSHRNAEGGKPREHATLRETFGSVIDVVGRLDAGRIRRQGRRALSERCQYVHVHVPRPYAPARPPGFAFCIRASLLLPLGFWHKSPSGSNACKSSLKAPSFARSDDLLVRQSPNLEFWRANQHFCSLFSSGKLDFEPVIRCLLLRLSAAPLIAHCDKDRVDIGQRRGDAPPVRGDFLVIR